MGYLGSLYNYVTKDESFKALLPVNLSFFFISVALYGGSNIEVIVLDSTDPPINGYIVQTLYWSISTPAPFLVPFLVRYLDIKTMMIVWSIGYTILSAMLIYPVEWVVYLCSTLSGFANVIALSVGSVLIATVSRKYNGSEAKNSGLWYLFQMTSLLLCNIIVYFAFRGQSKIDDSSRYAVTIPLTVTGVIGTIISFCVDNKKCDIRPNSLDNFDGARDSGELQDCRSIFAVQVDTLWQMLQTLKNWKALCLYTTGLFVGMECGFWMGVAQTAVGHSLYIENSKEIMGIMGFCVGVGELLASFLYTAFSSSKGDNGIFSWLAMATGLIGYYILYLVLPPESNIQRTYDTPYYIENTLVFLIVAGMMIGASDFIINAQFTAVFCNVFKNEDSSPYFAVQFFLSGIGGTLLFYTADKIPINVQLLVLSVLAVEAAIVYMFFDVYASWKNRIDESRGVVIETL